VQVRAATPEDFEVLGELTVRAYARLFDEDLGDYTEELRNVASRAKDSEVLVALVDDEVVGGVTYVPDASRAMSEFDDLDAAGVRMLAVDPDRQGLGAGRALLDACVTRARDARRARVILHSTPEMRVAHVLYGSFGFERAPHLDVAVREPPYSDAEPLLLMAFILEL
jgi:predicted N-acetyltransferase YhbS